MSCFSADQLGVITFDRQALECYIFGIGAGGARLWILKWKMCDTACMTMKDLQLQKLIASKSSATKAKLFLAKTLV